MSVARQEFMRNIAGIREAIQLESLAQGAAGATISPGIIVLRKGVLVASLVALESFIRDRTAEISITFQRWPNSFDELPEKLRMATRLEALSHLQKFARVLKRQGDDYENELKIEVAKLASGHETTLQLSKFVAGDFTGNLSAESLSVLVKSFQIKEHWNSFRVFASNTGFGVPSVEEVVKSIVRSRHKSAHSAGFVPNATDIADLDTELLCIGMCFDVAMTASVEVAIHQPKVWIDQTFEWRDKVALYYASVRADRHRITRYGNTRATAVGGSFADVKSKLPRPSAGEIAVVVSRDGREKPVSWEVIQSKIPLAH